MVRGPTLLGTAYSTEPASGVKGILWPWRNMVTVYDCRRLNPAAPGPSSEVIAGGTIGVPGATGAGELAGALSPLPAPAKPVKSFGARISVLNRMLKVTSASAS